MAEKFLYLAPEAVFPIVRDEEGKLVAQIPETGFRTAGTIQGEGKMAGVAVLFLRLSGCNLRCMWSLPDGGVSICDTASASFYTDGQTRASLSSVKRLILNNLGKMNHLIISGGEPFLQSGSLVQLIKELKQERELHISVETNGTIYREELVNAIDFFSISPKLRNSLPTPDKVALAGIDLPLRAEQYDAARTNIAALQQMIDHCRGRSAKDFQLKFVVQSHKEVEEIEASFLSKLTGWKPADVVLMPVGSSPEELSQTRMVVMEAAIERGWRYSPRLHITYFGGKAGV